MSKRSPSIDFGWGSEPRMDGYLITNSTATFRLV